MDTITSVAAMSTGMHQAQLSVEVALRTLKMATDQQTAALALLLRALEVATTGLGQYVDVQA